MQMNFEKGFSKVAGGGLWCVCLMCASGFYVQYVACALCGMCCLIDRYTMVRRAEIAGLKSTGAKH
jgi:hypothetical protein